ncbi:MAG: hypothetical protein K0S29_615 [Gammaproteobacteria bacterium]|nr:hypothetical protein [Gammaproteobacteria bacterium]
MLKSRRNYISSLIGPGIICYRASHGHKAMYLFAWQIYENERLFKSFSKTEQVYIKKVACHEAKDPWYIQAGLTLKNKGPQFLI